jgi:prevent-host-death family protein
MAIEVPALEARARFTQLLAAVDERDEEVMITKWGRPPAAVIISSKKYRQGVLGIRMLKVVRQLANGGAGAEEISRVLAAFVDDPTPKGRSLEDLPPVRLRHAAR